MSPIRAAGHEPHRRKSPGAVSCLAPPALSAHRRRSSRPRISSARPTQTLPDILSREPGIQVTNLFGGVNAARAVVDMRGFGAAAASNTLFLINGRRITDLDHRGVDLASIPRESIERIEITRGNSGVVLYGDGAIGGVINIVTKNGVGVQAGRAHRRRVRLVRLSRGQRVGARDRTVHGRRAFTRNAIGVATAIATTTSIVSSTASAISAIRPMKAASISTCRRTIRISACPAIAACSRRPASNKLVTERQGAFTPYDWAREAGAECDGRLHAHARAGLGADRRWRRAPQAGQSQFFVATETLQSTSGRAATDTTLTTASFTPRVKIDSSIFGMPTKAIGGFDYYRADYDSDRPLILGAAPIHRYDLTQSIAGFYWQQTVSILPITDISVGGRVQETKLARATRSMRMRRARSRSAFGISAVSVIRRHSARQDGNKPRLSSRRRASLQREFRGVRPHGAKLPRAECRRARRDGDGAERHADDLRSAHAEIARSAKAACRLRFGALNVQWSMYDMRLTDEIHFRFGTEFRGQQHQSRSDPALRSRDDRDLQRHRCLSAEGRPCLHAREVSRGHFRRQRRAAGLELDRQRRLVLGHHAEMADLRHGRALCRLSAAWTTTRSICSR